MQDDRSGRARRFSARAGLMAAALAAAASAPAAEREHERRLFDYVVSCALPAGTSVENPFAPAGPRSPGELGLAPAWRQRPLDAVARRRVTACVLARMNRLGAHVRIELRPAHEYFGPGARLPEEDFEGAFFGDLFANPPRLYACAGPHAPSGGSRLPGRDCVRPIDEADAVGPCGLQLTGTCRREAFVQQGDDFLDTALLVFAPR